MAAPAGWCLPGLIASTAPARCAGSPLQPGTAGLRQHRGTAQPWRCARSRCLGEKTGRSLGDPERCAAMRSGPDADRERLRLACGEWAIPGLWSELGERRASAPGSNAPLAMAHAARLFAAHASAPPSMGPWWLANRAAIPACSPTRCKLLLHQLIPIHSLPSLADRLGKRQGRAVVESHDLEQLYGPAISRHTSGVVTNLLEKLAIVTAACP